MMKSRCRQDRQKQGSLLWSLRVSLVRSTLLMYCESRLKSVRDFYHLTVITFIQKGQGIRGQFYSHKVFYKGVQAYKGSHSVRAQLQISNKNIHLPFIYCVISLYNPIYLLYINSKHCSYSAGLFTNWFSDQMNLLEKKNSYLQQTELHLAQVFFIIYILLHKQI